MTWLAENWLFVLALMLCAVGAWWLLPQRAERSRSVSLVVVLSGLGILAGMIRLPAGQLTENVLFGVFGGGAVLCAILMISSRNPVYAALWFALVTLCTCGLFLLQSAPFLAAATIIVYAGAIIVTFLFVIMLAQQSGATLYDARSRQPLAASLVSFVLLGALLMTLHRPEPTRMIETGLVGAAIPNPLSRMSAAEDAATLHGLGRSLFGDYLFAVEMAGTLLMVASIGAIAIAPRRSQGTL